MSIKLILLFCVQMLTNQIISSQYISKAGNNSPSIVGFESSATSPIEYWSLSASLLRGLKADASGAKSRASFVALQPGDLAASKGGSFKSYSSSPILPTGLTVASEIAMDGVVTVGGRLPFLGAVEFSASLPTTGVGSVLYSCESASIEMTTEDIIAYFFADEMYPYGSSGSYRPALSPRGSHKYY